MDPAMDWWAAAIWALLGALAGAIAPRLIASTPDIVPDPSENPDDFPEPIPFAELGRRPRLRLWTTAVGAVAAGVLGLIFGLVWGVGLVVVVLPFALALAVIDLETWYLPNRLIVPAALCEAIAVVGAAIALTDPTIALHALYGGAGLLAWYGLFWFISPRALAFGDVKLGGVIGLVLGPWGFSPVVLSIVAAGLVSLLALIPMRRRGSSINQGASTGFMKAHVPFGPSMLAGAWVALIAAFCLGTV